jgi:ribonuclease HI
LKHLIYVDAGFNNGKGRLAWFNEATNDSGFKKSECKDSFRCEYAAVVYALGNCKNLNEGDEVELKMDNEVVVAQLNRQSAINDDDIRKLALRIWRWGQEKSCKLTFVKVPRKENKAGKFLGS